MQSWKTHFWVALMTVMMTPVVGRAACPALRPDRVSHHFELRAVQAFIDELERWEELSAAEFNHEIEACYDRVHARIASGDVFQAFHRAVKEIVFLGEFDDPADRERKSQPAVRGRMTRREIREHPDRVSPFEFLPLTSVFPTDSVKAELAAHYLEARLAALTVGEFLAPLSVITDTDIRDDLLWAYFEKNLAELRQLQDVTRLSAALTPRERERMLLRWVDAQR
ncbi:MAG: hypothetical protein AB7P04_09730 [Bacteriovoracia bacterium]